MPSTSPRARSFLLAIALAALSLLLPAMAVGQTGTPATITSVVDGDTLHAQLADGRDVTVRLIGIDTPETRKPGTPIECGGEDASATMHDLADGQAVTLVGDPTQGATDRYGRSLFYVDRSDGLDLGLEMIRRGWSNAYVYDRDFQRLPTYLRAETVANSTGAGVWGDCDGDFHSSGDDESTRRSDSAKLFVRRYYARVSQHHYRAAWGMLAPAVKHRLHRNFRHWKAGLAGSLGVTVLAAKSRLGGRRAVVSVRLRSRDRDACSHHAVRQYFLGNVTVTPHGSSWLAVKFKIRKTRGKRPRLSRSECAPVVAPHQPRPAPKPPSNNCSPNYSPCVPGNHGDVDCGDLPGSNYHVIGEDIYGLDRDGDGVACDG